MAKRTIAIGGYEITIPISDATFPEIVVTDPVDGQILQYDNTTNTWKNTNGLDIGDIEEALAEINGDEPWADKFRELHRIEFKADSPEWVVESPTSATYTYTLTASDIVLGLYTLVGLSYMPDNSTTNYVGGGKMIIKATAPFAGCFVVAGTISYGKIEDLLGLILNEETEHTYTLDEIIGASKVASATLTNAQFNASVAAFQDTMQEAANTCSTDKAAVEAKTTQVENYYNQMVANSRYYTVNKVADDRIDLVFHKLDSNWKTTDVNPTYTQDEVQTLLGEIETVLTTVGV